MTTITAAGRALTVGELGDALSGMRDDDTVSAEPPADGEQGVLLSFIPASPSQLYGRGFWVACGVLTAVTLWAGTILVEMRFL